MGMVGFERAGIKIENEKDFAELTGAIGRVFRPEKVVAFLKRVSGKGAKIRDLEKILAGGIIEKVDASAIKSQALYEGLSQSDRAQVREIFLSKLEEVNDELRHKFKSLYQYY
jgi:hypothetical protein